MRLILFLIFKIYFIMGETIKEVAKKVVASIKKIFTPSQEIVKDEKEQQDSTAVNKPGQPEPVVGPSGF